MAQTPTLKSLDGSVGAITNEAFVSWPASKLRFAIASRMLLVRFERPSIT
jgi:hypothetical protein